MYHFDIRGSVKNKWELLNIRQIITSTGRFCLNIYIIQTLTDIIVHPQIIQLILRRLLGNEKWYQLRLRSRWHYQFSSECHNLHKSLFKIVETI